MVESLLRWAPDLVGSQQSRSGAIQEAIERMALSDADERGEVFTRNEVVEFILDLLEYTSDRDLSKAKILEPSFGNGEFLTVIVKRLLDSYFMNGGTSDGALTDLKDAVRAVEIHHKTFEAGRQKVLSILTSAGISRNDSEILNHCWLIRDDFLLSNLINGFTHVVGNPPYVRQEMVPDVLMQEYRSHFTTIYDRADIYVPFIEKGLGLLTSGGALGFICSDRWMKNRYGGPLRKLVSKSFHVRYYIDMYGTDAFHSEVMAYPAITVIAREKGRTTRIALRPQVEASCLRSLAASLLSPTSKDDPRIMEVHNPVNGSEPWLFSSPKELELLRRIEDAFPLIEEGGCKIGIGVATGRDKVFVKPMQELDIEGSRKLPLVLVKDITSGKIEWSGNAVINPFESDGSVIKLYKYPRLESYFEANKESIVKRNVAKKNPSKWYRTIDRIHEDLTRQPKLLIPDIKATPLVVYDSGEYYPHHNLYWITSKEWDLKALQPVLLSSVTRFFIHHYSVKMSGEFLRFQAQNLRRLRLPRWDDVPPSLRTQLVSASSTLDPDECDRLTFMLYGLNGEDEAIVRGVFEVNGGM